MEILKLKEMLDNASIPHSFKEYLDGYQIIISVDDKNLENIRLCDAVEHRFSYGHEKDMLEIMGALTEEEYQGDNVKGYLTAEEVFKRFKYCYEHKTSTYVE